MKFQNNFIKKIVLRTMIYLITFISLQMRILLMMIIYNSIIYKTKFLYMTIKKHAVKVMISLFMPIPHF